MILLPALLSLLSATAPDVEATDPHGLYVEARTATVFAGACHFGSEFTLSGRDAVLGFAFQGGEASGVALAGLDVVAVVSADRNLADAEARRRSVLYVPEAASPEQRAALEAWARERMATTLGTIAAVHARPVQVDVREDATFQLAAGEGVLLRGNGLPNRECCTMPFGRWYAPLVPVEDDRVGFAESFELRVPDLALRTSRGEDNCAFFGRF